MKICEGILSKRAHAKKIRSARATHKKCRKKEAKINSSSSTPTKSNDDKHLEMTWVVAAFLFNYGCRFTASSYFQRNLCGTFWSNKIRLIWLKMFGKVVFFSRPFELEAFDRDINHIGKWTLIWNSAVKNTHRSKCLVFRDFDGKMIPFRNCSVEMRVNEKGWAERKKLYLLDRMNRAPQTVWVSSKLRHELHFPINFFCARSLS